MIKRSKIKRAAITRARLRLGKSPATYDKRDLLFAQYRTAEALPSHPKYFGHEKLFGANAWQMLGNGPDSSVSSGFKGAGDCVFAGGDHETMLWTLEGGKPAEAIAPLRKAVQLSNRAPLIEMLLGQALVGTENKAYTDEAVAILRAAVARETEAPLGYTQLAMAYGRKGDFAEADLASAQAAFLRGDNKTARELASRAKTRFAIGTPGWVKADDIVSAKPLPGSTN